MTILILQLGFCFLSIDEYFIKIDTLLNFWPGMFKEFFLKKNLFVILSWFLFNFFLLLNWIVCKRYFEWQFYNLCDIYKNIYKNKFQMNLRSKLWFFFCNNVTWIYLKWWNISSHLYFSLSWFIFKKLLKTLIKSIIELKFMHM